MQPIARVFVVVFLVAGVLLPSGDSDAAGEVVLFINNISVNESQDAEFTISASATSSQPITFRATTAAGTATSPADFFAVDTIVTIPPNAASAQVVVSIVHDNLDELAETFTVNLSQPSSNATFTGGDASGTATIADDDNTPSLTVADASASEGGTVTFVVTKSADPTALTISFTATTSHGTAGASDYNGLTSAAFSIPPGGSSVQVPVTTDEDDIDESNETFSVTFNGVTNAFFVGGDNVATGTIVDDDEVSLSVDDVSVGEGASVATVTIRASRPRSASYTVNVVTFDGTADLGDDYAQVSQVITFAPGTALTRTVSVPIAQDDDYEDDETFTVNLYGASAGTIADPQGVVTIIDDDPAPTRAVTVLKRGKGTITGYDVAAPSVLLINCGVDCTEAGLVEGSQISVTAKAKRGHKFVGWAPGGPCAGRTSPCVFSVDSDATLRALFKKKR